MQRSVYNLCQALARSLGGTMTPLPEALPEGHTLNDWPFGYDELQHSYTQLEYQIGVTSDGGRNPFVPRSKSHPLPAMRPFRMGEVFRQATDALGLHAYPTPVAVNSLPYNGFSATTYCGWMGGFGSFNNERWHPGLTWVPEALATGNFDLRTDCRVVRVVTSGVEYAVFPTCHGVNPTLTMWAVCYRAAERLVALTPKLSSLRDHRGASRVEHGDLTTNTFQITTKAPGTLWVPPRFYSILNPSCLGVLVVDVGIDSNTFPVAAIRAPL
jgi:choline dehydrogenase-like flavoprotein